VSSINYIERIAVFTKADIFTQKLRLSCEVLT